MNTAAIETANLEKSYGDIGAVRGISLNVPQGSIYGFLGRNGAGKTTTIKMLLGLVRPTRGSARVLGMAVNSNRVAILQRTAFVSEKKTLYPSMTPSDLTRFSRGFYPRWSDHSVERYASLFEIPMKQRFDQLSNGNQTKVWLLLALCQGADLLILDEPTTALDPITVEQLMQALAQICVDKPCTVFFSSHQLEEVERIADYVGFIDHGELLMEDRLDDIKHNFRVVTATGNALPLRTSSQILAVDVDNNFYRYVVTRDADMFAASLSENGATITSISGLSLREIFLRLIGKGQQCTSGNAGGIPVLSSSRF